MSFYSLTDFLEPVDLAVVSGDAEIREGQIGKTILIYQDEMPDLWIKTYKNSPVVYLQFGDGPEAYQNPNFRRILSQAIKWASSDEAKSWARELYKKLS